MQIETDLYWYVVSSSPDNLDYSWNVALIMNNYSIDQVDYAWINPYAVNPWGFI
jgi:hypothetical protein